MLYLNRINGDEPLVKDQKGILQETPGQNQKKVQVVPVGQNLENQPNNDDDKLPQGYYIEKNPDETTPVPEPEPTAPPLSDDVDNEEIDTNIHPDQNVALSESIAIPSDETKPVDDVLENAARRGQNSILNNENITSLDRAETMVKDDPFRPLDQPFKKGFQASGLARFELNNQKYNIDETGADIRMNTSAQRIDLKATYESKSGNTKLFSYLKGAFTNRHSIIETANDPESEVQNDDESAINKIDASKKYSEYCAYFGLKQKFNNGNILSATAFHNNNEATFSKTTAVDAKYNLGIANVEGCTVVYNLAGVTNVKTNLSCRFNAFDDNMQNQEVTPSEEEENDVQNDAEVTEPLKQDDKKFERKSGLIIEFESEDESEQGLGYHWDFRKLTPNSRTTYGFFAKGSTTQRREESNSYHFTAGTNLRCTGTITPKTQFSADLDIKDKLTLGGTDKGNIFTAFGHARIVSPKTAVELEGCAVYTKDGRRNAIVLRGAYKPSNRVVLFGEGGYLYEVQPGMTTQNATFRAGVSVKLK